MPSKTETDISNNEFLADVDINRAFQDKAYKNRSRLQHGVRWIILSA